MQPDPPFSAGHFDSGDTRGLFEVPQARGLSQHGRKHGLKLSQRSMRPGLSLPQNVSPCRNQFHSLRPESSASSVSCLVYVLQQACVSTDDCFILVAIESETSQFLSQTIFLHPATSLVGSAHNFPLATDSDSQTVTLGLGCIAQAITPSHLLHYHQQSFL